MNNNVACRYLCLLVVAIGIVAGGVAQAQSTTSYPVSATCSGGGQLCNNVATIPVITTGLLQAQFSLGLTACSNIRIHFLVDGTEIAVTGFVAPGGTSSSLNLGPVSSGSHVLGLQAEGQVGGCNVGTLASWAGTALVTTASVATTQGIPTLSEWGLVFLATLLGALGISHPASRSRKMLTRKRFVNR
jgi:hypothetical protein